MDPLFMATSLFRRRQFEECVKSCTEILERNPYDQAAWFLKARALTEQTYVDEVEFEEEGIAEMFMDDTAIADVARPGTSLRKPPGTAGTGTSQGVRPISQAGRPLSGFVRPGTQGTRPTTMEQAIRIPRTARTARPVTTASGRHVRLGTASMLTEPGGPFIDVSKLNLSKYAQKPALAKVLFEYLFHHENNVRTALELAALATDACQFQDWWWKVQLGKCYYRLGLYRDAETQFKSALKQFATVDAYLFLCKVYVKLDQPMTALDYYEKGLERFKSDTNLLTGVARIHEGLNDLDKAVTHYREVLKGDSTNVEAIACIGTHHFYNDQPEIALRFYRRLLQMGVYNAELFTNLGLCCYYAQQFDMALHCLQRALDLVSDENSADVWYNIGHVALDQLPTSCVFDYETSDDKLKTFCYKVMQLTTKGLGDKSMAYQCFKLALAANNDHAEAYNNLGVLEWKMGRGEEALACFQSSCHLGPFLYEPQYNIATSWGKVGNLQNSYNAVQKSLEAFPGHTDSKELMKQLEQHFAAL